ncbi:MAG: hypothetical protein EXS00_00185 [Phycisphaerales bacterium]|nr:hypothetical protein [Phycisphaerales bacterium]
MLNKSRTTLSAIAVDIGRKDLRLLQLDLSAAVPCVRAHATLPCPIFMRDPISGEPPTAALTATLRALVREGGFSGSKCAVTLPSATFLSDTAELPTVSPGELSATVAWDAVDRFGLDHDTIETGALPMAMSTGNGKSGEFLVMAIRKDSALRATQFLGEVGLDPVRLESAAMASLRAAWRRARRQDGVERFATLYLEDRRAVLCVLSTAGLLFHRSFTWSSGSDIASVDSPIPVAGDREGVRAWRWNSLSEEVLQCLRRLEKRQPGLWPKELLLSGPAATSEGLIEVLSSVCGAPCMQFAQDAGIDWSDVSRGEESLSAWSAALGSALADTPNRDHAGRKEAA